MTVSFWTPTEIPLDAFTIMGANVKKSDNPIGQFGTGLKYALAVILRHGGEFRLFVRGTEYMFYLHKKVFRGQELEQVRMRKRKALIPGVWSPSTALPFTSQLGRNWHLWQAFRELESNTRDENGETIVGSLEGKSYALSTGTLIQIDCPGFAEQMTEAKVFLSTKDCDLAFKDATLEAYHMPSKYLYYRGIRIYELRYESRLTYNFKSGVDLTEDRTAMYPYYLFSLIANAIMQCDVRSTIEKVMRKSKDEKSPGFEAQELSLNETAKASQTFLAVAGSFAAAGAGGRSIRNYHSNLPPAVALTASIEMAKGDWQNIGTVLQRVFEQGACERSELPAVEALINKIQKETTE